MVRNLKLLAQRGHLSGLVGHEPLDAGPELGDGPLVGAGVAAFSAVGRGGGELLDVADEGEGLVGQGGADVGGAAQPQRAHGPVVTRRRRRALRPTGAAAPAAIRPATPPAPRRPPPPRLRSRRRPAPARPRPGASPTPPAAAPPPPAPASPPRGR